MYYTVIKHDRHLITQEKCRKHEPQASVFYISRVFSNVRSVLSQSNTRLRLLHLLHLTSFAFYVLYNIKHVDQSERAQGAIYFIIVFVVTSSLTASNTKHANLTWLLSEITHRDHTWHDHLWSWLSLTWLLYNLQLQMTSQTLISNIAQWASEFNVQ